MSKNKYAHLFHPPMTSAEARYVFFSKLAPDIAPEDKDALSQVYREYFNAAFDKEMQEKRDKGILFG